VPATQSPKARTAARRAGWHRSQAFLALCIGAFATALASTGSLAANQPPNGAIDLPAGNVTIVAGEAVDFQGTASDPDGPAPFTFKWTFGGGAVSRTSEDPGVVAFNAPGTYTAQFTVTDGLGLPDPTPATRIITVTTPAAPMADEVHWSIMGQTAVTFDWRGGSDTIDYGTTAAYGQTALAYEPDPMPFSSAGPFREARLTGLAENTTYHYSIGGGPDHIFRTPPPHGSSNFVVAAEGDIGSSLFESRVAPVQSRIASLSPDFVLMIGDLTYANNNGQTAADGHYNDVMVWSREAAYMPAWGNHEYETSATGTDDLRNYKGRHDLPNPRTSPYAPAAGCCGEDWYWFDYGNVRFIAYPEPYRTATITDWAIQVRPIMNAAQADPAISFIVTFGHRPAYSSGYHEGEVALRDSIGSLGATHSKYVLNLNGHSHDYERSYPQNGVVHITSGTGGSPLEEADGECKWVGGCPPPAWSAFRAMHHVVLKLHFTPNNIVGTAYCGPPDVTRNDISCEEGSVLDSFTIPGDDPNQAPTAAVAVTPATGNALLEASVSGSGSGDPDGTIVSYRFEFGDGAVVTQADPVAAHVYAAGTWTTTVTVTDNGGLTASASATVMVAAVPPGPNLVGNPSFEGDLGHWNGYNSATLQWIGGGFDGSYACEITGPAVTGSFGLNDSPSWVTGIPAAGTHYRLTAWVRSEAGGGEAKLRATEYLGTTKIGSTWFSPGVTLTPQWQPLTLELVSGETGSWLDVQVVDYPAVMGEAFVVDNISIRDVTDATVGVEPPGATGGQGPRAWVSPTPVTTRGRLTFESTRAGAATVEIFDLAGRRVARLLDQARVAAGRHEVGLGAPGSLGAGLYLYRVRLTETTLRGRFLVVP
jgi:PKD repeat protein